MRVDVLGPVRAVLGADVLDLGAPRVRALVAALALHADHDVTTDRLVDLVWGDRPPPGATGTLQAYVSGLRRVLDPDRARGTSGTVLLTVPGGYRLRLAAGLDAARFSSEVLAVRRRLGPAAALVPAPDAPVPPADEVAGLAERLRGALALWRGEPYADLGDAEEARVERGRLEELRLVALEDRAVLDLWAGQEAAVVAALEPLTATFPWRERLWGLRALALARSGRQADALAVLGLLRTGLHDELGLEPGAELRELQSAVLRQDAALTWSVGPGPRVARPGAWTPRLPATPTATPTPTPTQPPELRDRWPLVGRAAELRTVLDALDDAVAGRAGFVGLVGEPGIGKTRLARELARRAAERGVTALFGRCSADEGAPPLWPWTAVLRGLDRSLPDPGPGSADFARWAGVVDTLVATTGAPTLLVLDDLHWADPATLRVLRLLVEHPDPGRLLVLLTWRDSPPPTGALGDLVEALGRRHASRVTLTGLAAADAAEVVAAVAGTRPGPDASALLRDRTDGNPFYLVEYAQLAAEGNQLLALLAEPDPPTGVREVLLRRLERLPDRTLAVVRTAAVGGRLVELEALAGVVGSPLDAVLDDVEPAVAAGLLQDDGIDRFAFTHALVRDTAYASLTASRRARAHAAWAAVLEGLGGHETDVARHWAGAGTTHARRAWRSAVVAAATAARLHDHEEAARLLITALDALADDPRATGDERFEVLLELVEACRWSGRWPQVVATTQQAVELARALDDVPRLARAATGTLQGTVWQSSAYGTTDPVVVGALRESLRRLPALDAALRVRVMLALAVETYYGSSVAERTALVEESLAMAARLGEDGLRLEAHLAAIAAQWRPATAEQRLGWAQAAEALAATLGQERVGVVAGTLVATTQAELGEVEAMWATVARVSADAERLHLPYSQIALDELVVGLEAMAGRFDDAEATLARVVRLHGRIGTQQTSDAVAGSVGVVRQWQGRWDEVAAVLEGLTSSPLPTTAVAVSLLLQAGRRAEAEALLTGVGIDVEPDDWLSLHTWCHAAEAALALGDTTLAAQVYARLAPYAGRLCMAGSSPTGGPVDAALSMAARAVGETARATRHAEDALALMARWGLPLAARRLQRVRAEHGY